MSITINSVVYTYGGSTASVTGFVAGITTATIPSTIFVSPNTYNVTSIGNNAFQNCATLISVTIPNSVTTIGTNAFDSCANLTSVTLPTNASFTTIQGFTFSGCFALPSITIPSSVTSLGNQAFENCGSFTSINIPSSVTSIGIKTFQGCASVTSVIIPNSVTTIGETAFRSCTLLASVTLPTNPLFTTIGITTFQSCTSLTYITIPSSVTTINSSAFLNCSSLNIVYFLQTSTLPAFGGTVFSGISGSSVGKYYSSVPGAAATLTAQGFASTSPISNTIPTLTSITAFTGALNTLSVISYTDLVTNGNEVVVNTPFAFLVNSITSGSLSIGKTQGTATPWNTYTNYIINTSNTAYWTPATGATGSLNAFSVVVQDAAYNVSSPNVQVQVNIPTQPLPNPCFLEGTKILCFKNNEEVYRPIESLQNGDLVKTIYNGFLPICMMGTSSIYNPGNDYRVANRLYKCPKENYPSLFEDLYITGCHSILVLAMSDDEWENTKAVNGDVYVTDNHFRLIACADEKAEPFKKEGCMNIYHIALVHYDMCMNYGIYANGLLVESCSIDYLIQYSNMKILRENVGAVCQDHDKVSNNMACQLVDTY